MSVRKGVITGISPIQVSAEPSPEKRTGSATTSKLGRIFGRVIGRTVAKAAGEYGYEAAEVASGVAQDVADGAGTKSAAGSGNRVTAYLVMIRFNDGNESAIQSAAVDNLRVGGRVRVFGSGSSTQIVPE